MEPTRAWRWPCEAARVALIGCAALSACAIDLRDLQRSRDAAPVDAGQVPAHVPDSMTLSVVPIPDAAIVTPPIQPTMPEPQAGSPSQDSGTPPPRAGAGGSAPPPRRNCGLVGLPCCTSGIPCDLGACLRGTCTAYGGFYAHNGDCAVDPCSSRNAYTAGCSCPLGFDDTLLWTITSLCDDGYDVATQVRACTSERASDTGFGGLWVEEPDAISCNPTCSAPNPSTGTCTCPDGTQALSLEAPSAVAGCNGAVLKFTLCLNPAGKPLNFGGAYALSPNAVDGCFAPNPFTKGCTCPLEEEVPAPQNLHVGEYSIFVCNL